MRLLVILFLILTNISLFAQRGKDGNVTIASANTIVNAYTSLSADASIGTSTIQVSNSAGFNIGDLVLIVQMQGAKVNAFWEDGIWNDPNNSTANPSPTNLTYGAILDYYSCGNNEFAQISSIPNGTSIVLDCGLKNSYTYSASIGASGLHQSFGRVQVIKVPRYSSLTINGGGSITCPQWNGITGGVVAVEVENNAIFTSIPSINVSGRGFRGGIKDNTSTFGGNKWGAINRDQGAYKGESIVGDTSVCKNYAALIGRGAIANGGGGGNAHNAGGGGGANGGVIASYNGNGNPVSGYNAIWNLETAGFASNTSSGGGRGGYTFSNQNRNVTTVAPGAISTSSNTWGGDMRRNAGGFGGRPLDYSTGRFYLGGGGGAGDGNENQAGAGGNGGGIVFVKCYGDLTGAGTILANGANGFTTTAGCGSNDGGGGGGGGGTILLDVNGTISLTAPTPLSAVGGNGGNVDFNCIINNYDGYGPGGGGGGGYIASTGTLPANTVAGGANGIQEGNGGTSSTSISNAFPPNGATRGGSGGTGTLTSYTLNASANQTVCANQVFTVSASSTQPSSTINWYTSAAGGTIAATGNTYTSSYSSPGTYTLFAGECQGTYRQPIVITVSSGINISINSPTICPNQSVVLTSTTSATSYTWSTGANTSSVSVSPTITTIYTLNVTQGSCAGTQTTQVTVTSVPSLTVSNASICSGNSATLTANGATNYTWSPGGQITPSVVVTPTTNTTYTITGANGTCTTSTTASVNVTTTPTLATSPVTVCSGQVATFTVSGNATSYTWNPGNISGTTFTISSGASTSVSVLGANGSCTTLATTSLTVNQTPTITVNNPTICPGQSATLTANNATTYTWSTSSNSNSISVSPSSTTNYTVNGTSNGCNASTVAVVSVASQPTMAITGNNTICSGNSSTLTVNGSATNYTWMPGGQTTTSVVVSPTTTTIYTVTGTNGTCSNSTTASQSVTPTPTLVPISSTICPGQTATLTISGASAYTWTPGSITGSSYTIAPPSNTVVSIIGANGTCTSQATASVTIGSAVSISVSGATICPGQTATLTASGVSTFTWSTGSNSNSITVTPTVNTTYTVNGTQGTCSGTNTVEVTVIPQPTLSVSSTSICSGNSATLSVTGSATSFTWMPGGANTTSISVTPSTTSVYSVTGSNGYCSSTTTATVNVTNTPTLIASSETICPGGVATLTVSGASSYTWNPGSVTGSTYTLSPGTSTTVTVIGANNTCTSQTTASVTIGTAISVSVNSATICEGQSITLTATTSATSYTWNTGANTNSISVSPTVTTIYTVTGSNGSCSGSNTATVTVNSVPVLTVTSNNICQGQTATLTVSGANTYTWSNTVTGNTQTVSPISTTSYTVSGTSPAGCLNTIITSTTVIVTSIPNVSITTSPTICVGQSATLTAIGAANYTWSPDGQITSSIVVTPTTSASSYTVTGDVNGCSASYTTSVVTSTAPTIIISALSNTIGCPGLCVNFLDIINPAGNVLYNFGDGGTDNNNNPVHCYNNSGSFTVTATATDGTFGCSSTSNAVLITITNAPVADFTIQQGNIVGVGTQVNFINNSTNANLYAWNLDNGANSFDQNVSTVYPDTGTYCITLAASDGICADTTTKCIQVVQETAINIPNVFTPNGDNSNEFFKITGTSIKNFHCAIFDRWGIKLYEWDGINGYWDGSAKSGVAPTGTYYYIIEYTDVKDKSTTEKGFLSLFRE